MNYNIHFTISSQRTNMVPDELNLNFECIKSETSVLNLTPQYQIWHLNVRIVRKRICNKLEPMGSATNPCLVCQCAIFYAKSVTFCQSSRIDYRYYVTHFPYIRDWSSPKIYSQEHSTTYQQLLRPSHSKIRI